MGCRFETILGIQAFLTHQRRDLWENSARRPVDRLRAAAVALIVGMIMSAACTPVRGVVVRQAPAAIAPDEGAQTVDIPSLGVRIALGAVTPIVRKGDFAIQGGNPDGPMSADIVGPLTRVFFTCWDGRSELSCLSETSSIDSFSNLTGLYKDPRSGTFRTVLPGRIQGDPYEDIYAALQSTWRDPSTGTIHGWYHAEVAAGNTAACTATYASIGYATSTDNGHSFAKQGIILTSPYAKDLSVCQGQGVAGPNVVESGNYLYMFFTIGNTHDVELGGIGVARASTSSPGVWQHYFGGAFSEPGVGGKITPVIAHGGRNGDLWGPVVSWNAYLQKFLMLHSDYNDEGAVYVRTSADALSWSEPFLLMPSSTQYGYRYPTLFGQTDDVTAQTGWLFFGRTAKNRRIGPDTLMARRRLSLQKIIP